MCRSIEVITEIIQSAENRLTTTVIETTMFQQAIRDTIIIITIQVIRDITAVEVHTTDQTPIIITGVLPVLAITGHLPGLTALPREVHLHTIALAVQVEAGAVPATAVDLQVQEVRVVPAAQEVALAVQEVEVEDNT